jgi:hypothetical protein
MIRAIALAFLAAAVSAHAAMDANALLEAMKKRMQSVKKYTADLKLKVDIPFMKVPDADAKLTFKAPNTTKIESKSFAMLPKQGPELNALNILQGGYAAVDMGTETVSGKPLRKVKVLPADETSNIVVATLWIDEASLLARKVTSTTKAGGSVTAELVYDNPKAAVYCLPSYIKLMMEVPAFEIPRSITGDFDEQSTPKKQTSKDGKTKATVQIWYTKYTF